MLGIPDRTPYDLEFRLLGFPVRIHIAFWIGALVIGWSVGLNPIWGNKARLLWVGCVLVSVLAHELGHALAARATGQRPSIVLHILGGLCTYQWENQTTGQRLFVLACGPGAGFVLAGVVWVVGQAAYGLTLGGLFWLIGLGGSPPAPEAFTALGLGQPRILILFFLFQINLLWGLLNLLPIIPLDGGMMTLAITTAIHRFKGFQWAHVISLAVAGALAIWAFQRGDSFQALFLACFAGQSLMTLLALRQDPYAGHADTADWWKG